MNINGPFGTFDTPPPTLRRSTRVQKIEDKKKALSTAALLDFSEKVSAPTDSASMKKKAVRPKAQRRKELLVYKCVFGYSKLPKKVPLKATIAAHRGESVEIFDASAVVSAVVLAVKLGSSLDSLTNSNVNLKINEKKRVIDEVNSNIQVELKRRKICMNKRAVDAEFELKGFKHSFKVEVNYPSSLNEITKLTIKCLNEKGFNQPIRVEIKKEHTSVKNDRDLNGELFRSTALMIKCHTSKYSQPQPQFQPTQFFPWAPQIMLRSQIMPQPILWSIVSQSPPPSQ